MSSKNKYIYINSMEANFSPYDINLRFMRNVAPDNILDNPDGSIPIKIDEITVSMSPVHAKAMMAILYNTIQNYEKSVGPIPLSESENEAFEKLFINTK